MNSTQMGSEKEMWGLIGYKVRRKGVDMFIPQDQLTPKELRRAREDLSFLAKLFFVHANYLEWLESRLAECAPKNPKGS